MAVHPLKINTSLSTDLAVGTPARELARPLRVMHVITDLDTGGAEMMLYKVLSQMQQIGVHSEVISLQDIGAVGGKISRLGVKVHALNMSKKVPSPLAVWRLAKLLKRSQPDVIQTWMYHANLVGGLAAKMAGKIPVVWGIHHSNFDMKRVKKRTLLTMRAGALLSGRVPDDIICCGEIPRKVHIGLGYDARKMQVIPNGFDLQEFQPNPFARISVRKELGLNKQTPLIGLVARYHPKKDHQTFIQAASLVNLVMPDVHFLLCGEGVHENNAELMRWINEAGIAHRLHLLSIRTDIPRLTAALDIATSSSSYGEGFPISLGEAMACGIPCVATNVGDSSAIVGTTGVIVAPKNPFELSQAWQFILGLENSARTKLEESARQRIQENFNLPSVVSRYEAVYKKVTNRE